MAGFADLLGALVQNGLPKSGTSRTSEMFGGGGSLTDIVGSLGNMLGNTGGGGQSGLGGILGDVLNSIGNNKAALGGIGALGGALLGGGAKSTKGAIGGGALAMLAGLAMSALKNAGQKPSKTPRALMETPSIQDQQDLENDANVIVFAMINAAKADGQIDNTELQKIAGKFEEDGISQQEKDFFLTESAKPLELNKVIASAQGQAEMAAQIYAASLLAIEVDTVEEQRYMRNLAGGLGLDQRAVNYIEESLGVRG